MLAVIFTGATVLGLELDPSYQCPTIIQHASGPWTARCDYTSALDLSADKATLCAANREDYPCCVGKVGNDRVWCFQDASDMFWPSQGNYGPTSAGPLECGKAITSGSPPTWGNGVWLSTNCFPPPPAPAASEELSSGAIGGIVVGAYLGVAGAFGAYRTAA